MIFSSHFSGYFSELYKPKQIWNGIYHNCLQCDKRYKWKGSLMRHVRNECGQEPQQLCSICPYKTHQASHLRRHLRAVHRQELV